MTEPQPLARDEVEVAHEALIRHWPRLRTWLESDRAGLLLRDSIGEAAQEWDQYGRDESYLAHRGRRLDEADDLRHHPRVTLNAVEVAYLDAAFALRERETQEREAQRQRELSAQRERAELAEAARHEAEQRVVEQAVAARGLRHRLMVALGAVALAITAAVAAFYGFQQAGAQARVALSRQLAAQSRDFVEDRPDLSLLLSVEALRTQETVQAQDSLITALNSHPRLIRILYPGEAIAGVAFRPDGKTLVSVSQEGVVDLRDSSVQELLSSSRAIWPTPIARVALSRDGSTMALSSAGRTIYLWDLIDGKALEPPLVSPVGDVETMVFSPDGSMLASANGRKIYLWNLSNHERIDPPLAIRDESVFSLNFSHDSSLLASSNCISDADAQLACREGRLQIWNVATHQELDQIMAVHDTAAKYSYASDASLLTDPVSSLVFTPDNTTLISGNTAGHIQFWDIAGGKLLGSPHVAHSGPVVSLLLAPDGNTLASAGEDGTIRLWQASTRSNNPSLRQLGAPLLGHNGPIEALAFNPNGTVVVSAGRDERVFVWSVTRLSRLGIPLPSELTGTDNGMSNGVQALSFSADGNTLSAADNGGTVVAWNVDQREHIGTARTIPVRPALSVAIHPDGINLALSGSPGQPNVGLWSIDSSKQFNEGFTKSPHGTALAFSPDGETLAVGDAEGTITRWSVNTGESAGTPIPISGESISALAFSADGRILAAVSDDAISLWNIETGQPHGASVSGGEIHQIDSLALSPDGRMLAAGGCSDSFDSLRACTEGGIQMWDIATGQSIGSPFTGHAGTISAITFSRDGSMLATGSRDGTTMLWDVNLGAWQALACKIANRDLTPKEWPQFFPVDASYESTCSHLLTGEDLPSHDNALATPAISTAKPRTRFSIIEKRL